MQRSEPLNPSPSYAPLLETAYGALRAQILCVAAELGLAERLAQSGPVTASELAPKLGSMRPSSSVSYAASSV